jgi:hypothetical protein
VLAGMREAAKKCAPSLLHEIHSTSVRNTIATDSAIVYYYRSPGPNEHFRRAHGERRIPVWGTIPNEVQILLAA